MSEFVVEEATILDACGETDFPPMGVLEQVWDTDPIPEADLTTVAHEQVDALALEDVPSGGEIAVGAGSRGITGIDAVVRGTVEGLTDRGYDPFVFPAMGSHGGATAEGQRAKLAEYGITEDAIGCEIWATMEVEQVGETADQGISVVADANAVAADAIVPVNRIKPHTDFIGDVESGLSKMLVIGMGKQHGAKTAHEWAIDWSFSRMIPEIAGTLLDVLPVAGGVAIVEDQYHEPAIVEGIPPDGFLTREAELLDEAYDRMPSLPFDELDVLVLDRMGKDVSGAGMDTNVIGRLELLHEPAPDRPDVKRIFVRSLTGPSHGNAVGLGTADFVHRDLTAAVDAKQTLINALTAGSVRMARLPPVVETDRAGMVAALSTIGADATAAPRVIRATDTQHLKYCYASEPLVEAARNRDDLRVIAEPTPVEFARNGDFADASPMELEQPTS